MFKFRFEWTTIIFYYFKQFPTLFEKNFFFRKILLDMVPPVHPKKNLKKVNFFRIFSKFYHVILAYLGCFSSNFTCHKPFWRELQQFFQKIEKIRFSKNFQKLDLILTRTRKFEFLCSYKLRKGIETINGVKFEVSKIFQKIFDQKNENFYFWVVAVLSKIFVLRGSKLVFWQIFRKFPEAF